LSDLSAEKIRQEQAKFFAKQEEFHNLERKCYEAIQDNQEKDEKLKSYKLLLQEQEDHEIGVIEKAEKIQKKFHEEMETLKTENAKLQASKEQERVEKEAVQLRLNICEQQVLTLQNEIKQLHKAGGNRSASAPITPAGARLPPRPLAINTTPAVVGNGGRGGDGPTSITDMSISELLLDIPPLTSPLMSEDHNYQIPTLPTSPLQSPQPWHNTESARLAHTNRVPLMASLESGVASIPELASSLEGGNTNPFTHPTAQAQEAQLRLLQENEQLRQIIRTVSCI
jgi:hypothetical protein